MRETTQVLQPAAEGTAIKIPPNKHQTGMRNTIYTNSTDNFPVTSRRGHRNLIIMCELDSNTILSYPIKLKQKRRL